MSEVSEDTSVLMGHTQLGPAVESQVAVGQPVVQISVIVSAVVVMAAEQDRVGQIGIAAATPRVQMVGL